MSVSPAEDGPQGARGPEAVGRSGDVDVPGAESETAGAVDCDDGDWNGPAVTPLHGHVAPAFRAKDIGQIG